MSYAIPPLIDREVFFGDPEISGAQVSPDGKWMVYTADDDGRTIQLEILNMQPGSAANQPGS